ncbi:uncharacterized protein ISCGN_006234 [Ixodes scapularis]
MVDTRSTTGASKDGSSEDEPGRDSAGAAPISGDSGSRAPPETETSPPASPATEGVIDAGELMCVMTRMIDAMSRQMGTAPSVASAALLPIPRPQLNVPTPTYSGYSDAKSVHDFLQDLNAYVTALGASDVTALLQIVPIALTGDAARWRRLQTPFQSMADFRARFREEFVPPD